MTLTSPENASDSLAHALTKVSTGRAVLAIILGILSFYVGQVIVMAPLLPVLATNEYLGLFLATVLYNALVIASTWAIIRFLLKQRPGAYGLAGPVLPLR